MADDSNSLILASIEKLKEVAEAAPSKGAQGHAELLRGINDCLLATETPLETIYRIGHQVRDAAPDFLVLPSSRALTYGDDLVLAKRFDPYSYESQFV